MLGPKEVQPTDPDFPVRTCLPRGTLPRPPCSQLSPPHVLLPRSRRPGGPQGWCREMESEGAWEESLRVSRASAASSFRCHSKEAETAAWSEALGACKGKGVREWALETIPPPNVTSAPSAPSSLEPPAPQGLLLFPSGELRPSQGSGPHYFPRTCGCSRRGSGVAQGWRIRVEHLETRRGEARGLKSSDRHILPVDRQRGRILQ